MPLNSAKTFKEEEYWANLYGETIATPIASLPPTTPAPEPESEMGNFTRGLNAGIDQTQALGGGLTAAVGSVVGNDQMVAAGMETYQRNMAEAKEYAGDVMAVEEIESVGDFGSWAAYTLGTLVPDLAMGGVSAFAGKAVAKQVVKKGVEEFAEKEAKDIAQEALKAGVEKDAAEFIAREVAEKAAITQASKAAVTGAVGGAVAYSTPTLTGGSFASILEETGVEAPFTALGVGVVGAGLEVAPFMKAFRGLFPDGGVKKFKDFVAGSVSDQPKWMKQAFTEIVKAQGVEGGTEALQFLLEESAITFVNNNYTESEAKEYFDYLSNERKRSGLLNSAAAGILMGTGTGAGTVGIKTFKGQYKAEQSNAAGDLRTKTNNDPDLRSKVIEVFSKYENADANEETVLAEPTQSDNDFLAENEPLTPEQRQEAGLSELTDYDGSDMVIPEGTEPDANVPESAPVVEAPQQPMFAEDSLPPSPESPQADIVTDFDSAPAFGERAVPANSTESGTLYEYHNFEGQLSDPAKPVTDQLVELSVAANTPEALDPANTDVVVEAIDADDVDRIFDRNDFLKVETSDKPSGKSLPTVDESFGENAQEATDVVAGVVADLSASGVPKSFLDSVTGMYVHKESELDVPALTGNKSRGISLNSNLVSGAASDPKQLSELAWSMTHEVYHAADFAMGLSDKDPQFGITIVSERDQPTVVMGDVMDEIFTNWENRTELGKRFDYPFNDLSKEINDLDKPNEGLDKSYRQEVFAQLGAMFHSNPKLLQEQSPLAYNFIKEIRDSNLKTNNVPEVQSEGTSRTSDPDTTEPTGLRGQVRAPPESGSVESAPVADTGSDGEGSTGVGRTDSAVEGQVQEEAGQRERPAVQKPDVKVSTVVPTTVPIVKSYTVSEQTQEGNRQYTRAQGADGDKNTYFTEDERKNFVRGFRDGYQNTNGLSYNLDDNSKSGGSIYSQGYYSGSKDLRDINEENDNSGRDLNDGKGVSKDNSGYKQKQASRQSKPIEDTPVTIKLSDKKPTFKKAENWEDTGNQIVTFPDGDRYQVYFDDDASEGRDSGDDDVYYQSIDGKVADSDLGTTKKEALQAIIDHREKLFAAGKNSFNTPLDPEVGFDTYSKGYDLITDSPEGKLKLTDLRKKFKKLDDNQFDNLVEQLLDSEPDGFGTPKEAEDIFEIDGDFIVNPETVKLLEEERVAEERMIAEEAEFDSFDFDDTSFIKKSSLSPAAQKITVVDEIYNNKPISIEGSGVNGKVTIRDIGIAMDARTRAATGGKSLGQYYADGREYTEENKAIVSDLIAYEALAAMKADGNAGEWYQETVRKALDIGGLIHPEINTDQNKRTAFISIVAVTSNGSSVPENAVNSFPLYDYFNKNGKFKEFGTGKETVGMQKGFQQLNALIDAVGVAGMTEFLYSDFKMSDLTRMGFKVSGEMSVNDVKGSMILGAKIGQGFFQNLSGNFDPLTMDRWFMRTWGRLTGTMMADSEAGLPSKINDFRKIALANKAKLRADGIDIERLKTDDKYLTDYGSKVYGQFSTGGFKDKSKINEVARQLKGALSPREAPKNGSERNWIREVMGEALTKVNANSDSQINMGALQALIWYPEKVLFKTLGVGNKRSEPTDYETEFKRIAISKGISEESISGAVGSAQQSGAGTAQRVDINDDSRGDEGSGTERQKVSGRSKTVKSFIKAKVYENLRRPQPSKGVSSGDEKSVPRRFRARPSGTTKLLLDGISVRGRKRNLNPAAKNGLALTDSYNGTILELEPSAETAKIFASKMQDGKSKNQHGAAVFVYSEAEYQGMQLFVTEDGNAGIAVNGEEIVSLFSNRKNKNVTYALLSLAIESGGRKADAFDTELPYIYRHLGMKVISRLKWDDQFAPEGWDKKSFKPFNNGEPDVVFLRHDPEYFDEYKKTDGYYVDTYDEGLASINDAPAEGVSFIQKKNNNAKNNTLDDGSPSTSQFSFKDEIDGQSDLRRRFNKGRNPTVRSLSDRYDTLKQLEDQAADYLEVGRIPASMSPRDQENLSHGKVQDDLDEFHKTYVDVIGDLIHKSKIDPESIGVYLLAKHAQERNANVFEKEKAQREKNIARTKKEIQKLEDDVEVDHTVAIATQKERLSLYETMPFKFEDSGSGMTNGEAQSVLNTAEREGTKGQMEEIASKVYEMLQFQRDRMVKAGLLDEVSKADWEDTFKFYVPLKGFAAEENGDSYVRGSASRGFSIVGSESMKAKGRKTLPVNPLLTAIEDVQKKIIRARKNETAQTLLDLLSNLGTSDSYVIYNNKFRPPMESDPLTMQDLKSMSRDRRPNGDPKYVEVKKGGQTFFIYFKSDSLNHSLQNMSVPLLSRANESIGKVLTFATRFQTFRRNMLINYNPSWGLVNPIRDVQTALMYGLSEMDKKGSRTKGKNIVGAMAKTYFPAMRSLYRYYREKPVREGNEIDQYTQEFHDDGAQTGLMLVRDQAEQLRILKSKLKKGYTRDSIRSLLKFVEDFNTTMENSVRLSSYIEARKAGAPREDAATLAKDLTVNFNRKGEDTTTVNALYLFFNAAVQGNVNIMQALSNDGSSGKRFTTAQKTAAGLVAVGSSLALMNILNSEDDDDGDKKYEDLPEHAKNRSLLIMGLDGEEGFALPAPYGYNFFTNIGRYGTELAMGVTEIEDVAVNLADNILLNFVPITPSAGDNWAENVRGAYPDLLELHQDLVANKDSIGRDIAVEQNPLFVKRSQSYVAKRATGKNFKEITKFMNDATGGDEFEDGLISFSPDRMQYAYSYFFGGLGRSASQAGDVMSLMMADEEVRKQDMPVVSTFFKRPSENEDRFEYYDNWEEVRQIKTQLIQTTDPQEKADLIKKFSPFFTTQAGEEMPVLHEKDVPNLYDLANKDIIKIRKSRKLVEKQNYGAGVLGEEKRRQVLDELEKDENLIFDIFNKAYRKAEKKAKG